MCVRSTPWHAWVATNLVHNPPLDITPPRIALPFHKIRHALSEPYRLAKPPDGQPRAALLHHCTASIGLALFDAETGTLDALLSSADRAMYRAKADGPNSIRLADGVAGPA